MTANEEKIPLLIGLLRRIENGRVMVFANTKRETEGIWGYLTGNGLSAAILSGDVPQKQRLKLLRQFQEGELPVLVATDVAARGLHIPDVTHVINYDLPEDAEDYVHRIGRTARAGAAGDAISFVCETYAFCLPDIEDFIGIKIRVEPVASDLLAEVDPRSFVRPERRHRHKDKHQGPGGRHKGKGKSGTHEHAKAEAHAGDGESDGKKRRRRRARKTAGPGEQAAAAPT
jgi:ATP-dependent RNA helicase RhlB